MNTAKNPTSPDIDFKKYFAFYWNSDMRIFSSGFVWKTTGKKREI